MKYQQWQEHSTQVETEVPENTDPLFINTNIVTVTLLRMF